VLFRSVGTPKDTSENNFIQQVSIKGDFSKGDKNGKWSYQLISLSPTTSQRIEGYNVVQLGTGKELSINASFEEDKATGKWSVFENLITNSKVKDTTYKAEVHFMNNYFTGKLKSSLDTIKLEGFIDDHGYIDGEWSITIGEKKEIRQYKHGVIIKHLIISQKDTIEINHFGLEEDLEEEWEEMPLGSTYFDIILESSTISKNGKEKENSYSKMIQTSNLYLDKTIRSFLFHDKKHIWSIGNDESLILSPKIKVKPYLLTSEEKKQLKKSESLIEEINKSLNDFLKDPQVEINKHAFEELAKYFEAYSIYKVEVKKIETLISLLRSPAFNYINRDKVIPYLFEGTDYPNVLTFEFENKKKEFSINFPKNLSQQNATIASLYEHLESIKQKLVEKKNVVNPIIERNKKRIEIAEKEELLLMKRDSVKTLFANESNKDRYNNYHRRFKDAVINYTSKKFKEYASKDIEERINITDQVIFCFETFIDLYSILESLPEMEEDIKERYTRVVWNPFTFTDMEETIKERVFNAYKNILFPYVLEDLEDNITCEKLDVRVNNFTVLNERMKTLVNQDTKELERHIRKANSINELILHFNLELQLGNNE